MSENIHIYSVSSTIIVVTREREVVVLLISYIVQNHQKRDQDERWSQNPYSYLYILRKGLGRQLCRKESVPVSVLHFL